MQNNQRLEVRWRKVTRHTYQHGATIQFHDNYTYYENQLMPSGLQINLWEPSTLFDKDGHPPKLPMLKRGYHYHISLNISAVPEHSVYVIVTFYLKNGTQLEQVIIKEDESEFKYPNEAYSYDIRLMNAACHHLKFKNIILTELDHATEMSDSPKEPQENINDKKNDNQTSQSHQNVTLVNQIMRHTRTNSDYN